MSNEMLNASSAGIDQAGVDQLPYHSPKFVSLGPIQSLVQSGPGASNDGGLTDISTASGV
jgi:hypothetical protein